MWTFSGSPEVEAVRALAGDGDDGFFRPAALASTAIPDGAGVEYR